MKTVFMVFNKDFNEYTVETRDVTCSGTIIVNTICVVHNSDIELFKKLLNPKIKVLIEGDLQ